MEYFENKLCVAADWLEENGILSRDNLRQLATRNKANIVRRGGGMDTPALTEYERLPERFKAAIRDIIGDPYKDVVRTEFERHIADDDKLRNYQLGHKLPN